MKGAPAAPAGGITAEEGALIVEELEATAPVIEQSYPDPIAVALRAAVTDADLFLSYNLPEKAMVPLLGALPQAPRDVRLNQRLAALHTRFQRFSEAAVCCRTLETLYHNAGYPDEALRYGELAARFELNPEGVAAAPPASFQAAAASWPSAGQASTLATAPPEFAVEELGAQTPPDVHDLSFEWQQTLSLDQSANLEEVSGLPGEDSAEIAETVEEIRFYLEHFMHEQAQTIVEDT
jgi:hypothetical protein